MIRSFFRDTTPGSTFSALLPLGRALLGSLLIHGLILLPQTGLAPHHQASTGGSQVQARIKAIAELAPSDKSVPSPAVAEQAAVKQPEEGQYPAPTSQPAANTGQTGRTVDNTQAQPNTPTAPVIDPVNKGVDIAGLREYHLALGRMAGQFRRYPPAAREAGRQGRVAMRLAVGDNGLPIGISLLGSSQHPELDQAALDMLRLTAAHTPVPESLRGQHFTIDLAIDFKPDDPP